MENNIIKILDNGYVRLVDHMGSDLTVVNSARVSFDKESKILDDKDIRLINFLAKHGHTSPFRHAMLQFECYVPLMVARQHWKYVVGSSMQENMVAWNEGSRRYVTEEPMFYTPSWTEWRMATKDKKQGSDGNLAPDYGEMLSERLIQHQNNSLDLYNSAMDFGVAPEQARLFLPAYGLYVRYYWTCSLQGVLHFLEQRLEHSAQFEIQALAKAVDEFVRREYPKSHEAWRNKND